MFMRRLNPARLCLGRRWESREAATSDGGGGEEKWSFPPPPPPGPQGTDPRQLWRLDTVDPFLEVPEAWVESMDSVEGRRLDLVQLHPDVWRVVPRMDLLTANLTWQNRYRNVIFEKALSRSELPGSGKKIWPQNARLGKSRQKSRRSPLWIEGGLAHGIRGPLTYFYMLPQKARIMGLTTALTLKHIQDDLVIVDDFARLPVSSVPLERGMPKEQTKIWELSEARNWGYSCLFIHLEDVTPRRLGIQCAHVPGFTPMPLAGLNCHSLLKHDTLVITRPALDRLESRLLEHIHKAGPKSTPFRYKDHKDRLLMEAECEAEAFYHNYAERRLAEEDPNFRLLPLPEQKLRIRERAKELLDSRPPPFV